MNVIATFGTLTDYATGIAISPASAEEWRFTALTVNGDAAGSETGAWLDDNGRAVWVEGGPRMEVTGEDIAGLEQEAAQHGDERQAALCRLAFSGEHSSGYARTECVRIIIGNRLNSAGE